MGIKGRACGVALLAALAGCANPEPPLPVMDVASPTPAGPPRPAVVAAVARLPPILAIRFERASAPRSDGMTGLMVRYNLGTSGSWATVFAYDAGQDVPDGLDSPVLRQTRAENLQVARGNAENGAARQFAVRVPGAPPQACAVGRAARDGRSIVNYGCATGVGGVILKARLTFVVPQAADAPDQDTLDKVAAVFVLDATRVVAGQPPLSAGTPPARAGQTRL